MAKQSPLRNLIAAIKKGDTEAASSAIAEGVDLSKMVDGMPPLGWAVSESRPEIVRLILEAGGDPDAKDDSGSTPLQACAAIRRDQLSDEDSAALSELLIAHGADVTACDDFGHDHAPLAMARMRGKRRLAKLLEEHGARVFDVEVTMKDGQGKPLSGEFYFGIPGKEYVIAEVKRSGKLTLKNVFPGEFLIGYEGDEQVVTVTDDGAVVPDELAWETA
jgi:hypothetical protein